MDAIKGRSFKKMFERPAHKNNFLDNVTLDNSTLNVIEETPKPSAVNESNTTNIVNLSDAPTLKGSAELTSKTNDGDATIMTLQSELTTMQKKLSFEKELVETLKDQIKQLTMRLNVATQEQIVKDELQNKVSSLEADYTDQITNLQNELAILNQQYSEKCLECDTLSSRYESLEQCKSEIEAQLSLEMDSQQVDDVITDECVEVTSVAAENEKLCATIEELEQKLNTAISENETSQMLYHELRTIMIAIGVEKNLDVFDRTKLELQQKSDIIEKQNKLLHERDQYITTLQDSLMDGIGQMFSKRPTSCLLEDHKLQSEIENDPPEIKKKKNDTEDHSNTERNQLINKLANSLNRIANQMINEKEEEYLQYLKENWIDIKQEAKKLKTEGWNHDEIAELLAVEPADLTVIINRRLPKTRRAT